MADEETQETCDAEEEILQRHKKERKLLQGEIQKLKHRVGKSDKKKKKEVTEKIALMEAELNERQDKELAASKSSKPEVSEVTNSLQELNTDDSATACQNDQPKKTQKSKAQKRREKKMALDQEREERIREQEIDNLTSSRHLEAVKIKALLAERGLQIHEIPSDGNCLYAAVVHQLALRKIQNSVETLRTQVAEHLRQNQDDFIPFLYKDNGDCFSQDDFEAYCVTTATTAAWGGQLEIQALSSVLKVPIEVVQSEGPPIVTGNQPNQQQLILTYYRHAYGLGEHYHSVEDKTDSADNEDS